MSTTFTYNRVLRIVIFSAVIGFIYNYISDNGINIIRIKTNLIAVNDSTLFSKSEKDINTGFKLVTSKQAYKLYKSNKAIFIDARDKWDFAEGHIPGSINIPEYDFAPGDTVTNSIDKKLRYIVYCDGNDCDVSIRLAKKLMLDNFNNLLIYESGWSAWKTNGYPIEKGNNK